MKLFKLSLFLFFINSCGGKFATQTYVTGISPVSLSSLVVWYDAADVATLFTDSTCSTQVSEADQSVGCWQDKSGNLNHATAIDTSNRGVFKSDHSISIGGLGDNTDTGACYNIANTPDARTIIALFDDVSESGVGRHGVISQDNTGAATVYLFLLTDNGFGNHTARFDGVGGTGVQGQVAIDYGELSINGGYAGSAEYGNFPIGGPTIMTGRYITSSVSNWAYFGCIENVNTEYRYSGEYKVKEFLMWDRELTIDEIGGVRRYLRSKWNI